MDFTIQPVHEDDFCMELINGEVILKGSLFSKNSEEVMEPFFTTLHKEILEHKVKKIVVDITELTFLNSSGIKVFASWITAMDSLPDENSKYRILFKCSSQHLWQDTSVTTLTLLNPDYVKKEFIGNFDSYV